MSNDNNINSLLTAYGDKYKNQGLIARTLIDNFFNAIDKIVSKLPSNHRFLECGCGPGESSTAINKMMKDRYFEVSEFEQELVDYLSKSDFPLTVTQESVYELKRKNNEFNCVILLEVLEHLESPQDAISELFRVASDDVIISVPNEPLWRVLNFCRGKYWSDLGNTPGHINHWNKNSLTPLLLKHGTIEKVYKPLPWMVFHCKPF